MQPWREIQKRNFTDIEKLISFLELDESMVSKVLKHPKFPLNLPERLAQKIQKKTLNNPILRQFLPLVDETKIEKEFLADPVSDLCFLKQKKLLHKYTGRALLLCSSACAMHCRFCFRQNFPYETEEKLFTKELEEIRQDPSISELILSGGDPLSLSNRSLQELFLHIKTIPHIKRLRFHSRFPIGIPERIDEEFLAILQTSPLQIYFILHCNHPQELDADVCLALKKIQRTAVPVLNQAVLLKGVNDDLPTLHSLFSTLINEGILPYYLHQLDKVQGSSHFEVEEKVGLALIAELKKSLPGYGVPRYVREIAGEESKTELHPV